MFVNGKDDLLGCELAFKIHAIFLHDDIDIHAFAEIIEIAKVNCHRLDEVPDLRICP